MGSRKVAAPAPSRSPPPRCGPSRRHQWRGRERQEPPSQDPPAGALPAPMGAPPRPSEESTAGSGEMAPPAPPDPPPPLRPFPPAPADTHAATGGWGCQTLFYWMHMKKPCHPQRPHLHRIEGISLLPRDTPTHGLHAMSCAKKANQATYTDSIMVDSTAA